MSDAEKPAPEEINSVLVRLAELAREAEKQTQILRKLVGHCDAQGIENVDWFVLVEIVARTEMLRRLHDEIARGRLLIGADPGPTDKSN